MKRALSIRDVITRNKPTFDFSGEWAEAFGSPSKTGVWFIWGGSGSGKTSFAMQLCKELSRFGRVAYNSLEEGADVTMKNTLIRFDMEKTKRMILLDCESIEDMEERMNKRKSPDFYVIDSFQYTQMTYRDYQYFKEAHRDKLIIFISHADGKMPAGKAAQRVMYDASLKIYVEGGRAFSKGRFFGTKKYFTVWAEGAERYWGNQEDNPQNKTKNYELKETDY